MIHPETELRFVNDVLGYGVFATGKIPRGTVIWTLCDLDARYRPEQVEAMPRHYRQVVEKYAYIDAAGIYVLCWDFGRYVNHSCNPTSFAVGAEVEIVVRDVLAGEQITCDYGLGNLHDDLACHCGSDNCRGSIKPSDVLTFGSRWDEVSRSGLPFAANVPQPLRPFIRDWGAFAALVKDPSRLPAHASLYCPPGTGMVASAREAAQRRSLRPRAAGGGGKGGR
jgi:hypothetical protein